MAIDDAVKDGEVPAWQDLFSMGYAELKALSDRHRKTLAGGSGADIQRIAHLHAYDVFKGRILSKVNWAQVASYVKQMLEEGKIDPFTAESVLQDADTSVSFQRIRTDKPTAKLLHGDGLIMESARFYPTGTVVRAFHSIFYDESAHRRAVQGQQFYHALVGFVNRRFSAKNTLSPDERYVAERLARARPILPLYSDGATLDNVFIDGSALDEHFSDSDISVDERVATLSEVTDIDLITSYFSPEFRQTREGRKICSPGLLRRRVFKPKDYRQEVFEDVLIKADKELAAELSKHSITTEEGKVSDPKALAALYSSGAHSRMFSLIGIREDNVARQKYFSPYDVNLGNIMMVEKDGVRSYTHIDFEDSREESLESLLFRRWARSGIYDHKGGSSLLHDGKPAEDALLSNAYGTVARLHSIDGKQAPSFDGFVSEFRMHKKKSLLRFAASYKARETGADSERSRAHKRFFYTLFVRELGKEGDVADDALEYLDMLFERPLTEAEMSEVAEKYSPRFSSMDISLEAELKKQDIDERLRSAVQSYRDERSMRRWVRGVAAVGLIGLAAIAYIGFKSAGREKEAAEKAREDKAEVERDYKLDMKQRSLHKFDTGFHDNDCYVTGWWLDRLGKHFPDPMTARAAYVDIDAVYAAIQECGGKSDWQTVRKYLYDNGRYDVIFAAEPEEEYADNVIRMDPGAAFDEFVREYIQKAAEKYNARKAAENRPASSEGINLPVGVGKTTFLR